ncbi:hypothetical protein BHG07_12025 [Brenneria salicis ATCC 15712 = DSM 30166]|nr:hypothetical protein BHG07_12025 [Brenneria salicis ATCC 15712 = DSM 30166]
MIPTPRVVAAPSDRHRLNPADRPVAPGLYAAFYIGAGHGIGFNDQKTVEVHDLIDGITADLPLWPDFEEGWKVSCILDAIVLSHQICSVTPDVTLGDGRRNWLMGSTATIV